MGMNCTVARAVKFVLLVFLVVQPALAQGDSIVEVLLGEWKGHGKLFEAEATFSMKW